MDETTRQHAPGEPDIPEERNPLGHDSQPDPSPGQVSTVGHASTSAAAPGHRPSASEDTKFVAENFEIPEKRAARLVAGSEAPESRVAAVAAEVRQARSREKLEGVPTPSSDPDEFVADADETDLKPVLRTPNERG